MCSRWHQKQHYDGDVSYLYMCIMISLYIILFKHISESAGEDIDECLITLLEWEMRDAQLAQMIQVDCNECQKGIKKRRRKRRRKFLHIHKMLIWMCIKWYPSYGDDLSSFLFIVMHLHKHIKHEKLSIPFLDTRTRTKEMLLCL